MTRAQLSGFLTVSGLKTAATRHLCPANPAVRRLGGSVFFFLLLLPGISRGAGYSQMAGLVDLRSTFSDGDYSIGTLAKMAGDNGFGLVFINDHDREAMEYGLPPLRNVLGKRVEMNSINREGAGKYLAAIARARKDHPGMLIIPGSECAPFYYWTGSYFGRDLTAHEPERRILTIGMDKPEDYRDLPVLQNSPDLAVPALLLAVMVFGFSIRLLRRGSGYRPTGLLLLALAPCLLLAADADPFRKSPFDQYHGPQGIAPYQFLVNYVASKGGLTFWNYPETHSGVRRLGPIRVDTPPYPEALEEAKNYTGFAAVYGDNITATAPGNVWDRVLNEYCEGRRARPVWGIATADYHGPADGRLGDFPTVFLVRKRTVAGVLEAMRKGRMYAEGVAYPQFISLDEFSVSGSSGGAAAVSGDSVRLEGRTLVRIRLSEKAPSGSVATVRLIKGGKIIKTFRGKLPLDINYDDELTGRGLTYYRMDMSGPARIISNPIFVENAGSR